MVHVVRVDAVSDRYGLHGNVQSLILGLGIHDWSPVDKRGDDDDSASFVSLIDVLCRGRVVCPLSPLPDLPILRARAWQREEILLRRKLGKPQAVQVQAGKDQLDGKGDVHPVADALLLLPPSVCAGPIRTHHDSASRRVRLLVYGEPLALRQLPKFWVHPQSRRLGPAQKVPRSHDEVVSKWICRRPSESKLRMQSRKLSKIS